MLPKPFQSSSPLEDTFLVLRCQAGDEAAFGKMYGSFEQATRRYLTNVVGPEHALDVQQDAWITVFRKISDLQNPKRFKPWLYRIVRNAAIDLLRKLQREDQLFVQENESLAKAASGQGEDHWFDAEAIESAIYQLSPAHREVVVFRYWEGFSYGEIALITGIPLGSVRSRLFHAKSRLEHIFTTEINPL